MATRISVRKNSNGQFVGWICKHSAKTAQPAESNGHVILCDKCAASVRNGAELLDYLTRQPVEATKLTEAGQAKRAAAAAK
jgi:hypothetical protein